ncbi:N,N-dimethylformamidase beta subunit family domain-containing protein [Streptomyces sp. NPDC048604]|uniref:N,N-dimethylformamidase beta subunit family domain-containing protein n=1 Tax=Streptomyces sp. NPDC048604 TaxID=3365578 RepID=UPI003712C364
MGIRSRRAVLGLFGLAGAAGASAYALRDSGSAATAVTVGGNSTPAPETSPTVAEPTVPATSPSILAENRLPGSKDWIQYRDNALCSSDMRGQIMGYASTTSAGRGELVDFHVSVRVNQNYRIAIYRIGDYGGAGARLMTTSEPLRGIRRPVPAADPKSGAIECAWPVSWSLRIPDGWLSGLYQAVFTADDGHRSSTPFVVREPERASALLVVIPFATYQAYNMWPKDKRTGKNLYRGYLPDGKLGGTEQRARKVSFDRPYSGSGVPSWFNMDSSFARWAEAAGYDVTYASSLDLHDGTIDPAAYRAVVFPGHDEYWSQAMFDSAMKAVHGGRDLAFLGANNVYFHVRMERSRTGVQDRLMACYKSSHDPAPDAAGRTSRFREVVSNGSRGEQQLLGIQFNGIVPTEKPFPLVVKNAGHWLWEGTGVLDGERLPGLVGIEADAYDPRGTEPAGATRTLLAESPYKDSRPGARQRSVQHTALTEFPGGGSVFVAGTFHWPIALVDGDPWADEKIKDREARVKIRRATANLVDRMLG